MGEGGGAGTDAADDDLADHDVGRAREGECMCGRIARQVAVRNGEVPIVLQRLNARVSRLAQKKFPPR